MEIRVLDSGLAVPHEPPKVPARKYGPLEIHGDEERARASNAMKELWDVMELHDPPRGIVICAEDEAVYAAYLGAWELIGRMLLGEDIPKGEVLC